MNRLINILEWTGRGLGERLKGVHSEIGLYGKSNNKIERFSVFYHLIFYLNDTELYFFYKKNFAKIEKFSIYVFLVFNKNLDF